MKWLKLTGVGFVCAWYLFGGIAHFTDTEFFVSLLWPSFPLKVEVVLITGVIEIALALLIWVPAWRQRVGDVTIAFTLAVTPVNVYHWLYPERFPDMEPWQFSLRLLVQVLFIALIWWSTRPLQAQTPVQARAQ